MGTILDDVKLAIKKRFTEQKNKNLEKKANILVKDIAKKKSGGAYRKGYEKEILRQAKLKGKLDAQAQFKSKTSNVKAKLQANLTEIIKSVSPQPKKTNANFDLGYRSLY